MNYFKASFIQTNAYKEKLINDSIRQAICFKALQTFEQLNYKGRYSIDDISFSKLHTMSTVLSSNIKDEQAYILNSFNTVKQLSEMMKIEKCEKTQLNNGTIQELISTNIKEMSNMSYKEPIKETSKDFEIGL